MPLIISPHSLNVHIRAVSGDAVTVEPIAVTGAGTDRVAFALESQPTATFESLALLLVCSRSPSSPIPPSSPFPPPPTFSQNLNIFP